MGECSDRDNIDACLGNRPDSVKVYPSGSLYQRAAADQGNSLMHERNSHIVEHDDVRPCSESFLDLGERFGLDFDFKRMGDITAGAADRFGYAAGGSYVVFLDENAVVETGSVVAAAADPDGVFFQDPQSGVVLRVSTIRAVVPRTALT